jgi:hypothetical protein
MCRVDRVRGERGLVWVGDGLVRWASRRLPRDVRDERYREWSAELPAILHDPEIGLAPWRAVRMLSYAADTLRGAARTAGRGRRRFDLVIRLMFAVMVAMAGDAIWTSVRTPGNGPNYLKLTWALLNIGFCINESAHRSARIRIVLWVTSSLVLAAQLLWEAAETPGDWWDYALTAVLFLAAGWAVNQLARTRPAGQARSRR